MCYAFLLDSIDSLGHLPIITHKLHKKRWNKYYPEIAYLLTEFTYWAPPEVYHDIKQQILNAFKQMQPDNINLQEGRLTQIDVVNLFMNIDIVLKSNFQGYKDLRDNAILHIKEKCILKSPYDPFFPELLWVHILDYYMQIFNEVHIGAKHPPIKPT